MAVWLALPLGGERAGWVRSGTSGSVTQCGWYARGRVAVWLTLPLGGERAGRIVQARVAVRPVHSGPSDLGRVDFNPEDKTSLPPLVR